MGTRFKLDENLPRDAEAAFREAGLEVDTAAAEGLEGRPDSAILEACRRDERVLVTLDLDFADIRHYPPEDYPGFWVLRTPSQSLGTLLGLLKGALTVLESESAANRLWIIEPERVRIHE